MDTQHTEQTHRLETDLRHLGNRFDRHLEIYAANGKELAAVKANVASLEKTLIDFYSSFKIHEQAQRGLIDNLVTTKEFTTIKSIVYGAVGLVLVAFMGALVTLVIK